jgi:hypothetical protein
VQLSSSSVQALTFADGVDIEIEPDAGSTMIELDNLNEIGISDDVVSTPFNAWQHQLSTSKESQLSHALAANTLGCFQAVPQQTLRQICSVDKHPLPSTKMKCSILYYQMSSAETNEQPSRYGTVDIWMERSWKGAECTIRMFHQSYK